MKRRQRRHVNPKVRIPLRRAPSAIRAMIDDELTIGLQNAIDREILNFPRPPRVNTKTGDDYITEFNEQVQLLNKGKQNRNPPPKMFFGNVLFNKGMKDDGILDGQATVRENFPDSGQVLQYPLPILRTRQMDAGGDPRHET